MACEKDASQRVRYAGCRCQQTALTGMQVAVMDEGDAEETAQRKQHGLKWVSSTQATEVQMDRNGG